MLYNNYINPCAGDGISLSSAAEKAGLAPSVYKWQTGAKPSDLTICRLMNANGWTKDDLLGGKEEATVLGGDFFLFYTSRQTAPILSFKLYPGADMSQASGSIVGGLTCRNQQFTLPTAPVLV